MKILLVSFEVLIMQPLWNRVASFQKLCHHVSGFRRCEEN